MSAKWAECCSHWTRLSDYQQIGTALGLQLSGPASCELGSSVCLKQLAFPRCFRFASVAACIACASSSACSTVAIIDLSENSF